MTLAVGSRIGAFEITGTLGAGGMGEVYRARDTMLGVPVQIGSTFTAGKPARILNSAYYAATNRSYDVSLDGQRFLMIKEKAPEGAAAAPASIVVVINWFEELKKLIPNK